VRHASISSFKHLLAFNTTIGRGLYRATTSPSNDDCAKARTSIRCQITIKNCVRLEALLSAVLNTRTSGPVSEWGFFLLDGPIGEERGRRGLGRRIDKRSDAFVNHVIPVA
jgi:hypothetical protein